MAGKESLLLISVTVFLLLVLIGLLETPDMSENEDTLEKIACPSGEVTEEDLYMQTLTPDEDEINKPPVSSIPAYRSITNSHGLRDQKFSVDKPDNQFRVFVVGDSQTYGLGVNESDRFTEVLERKIGNSTDKEVRVINAGLPGAGMRDYYQIVLNKGVRYDPDLVVVAFDEEDVLYRQLQDSYIQEEKKKHDIPENVSIYSVEEAEDAVDERLRDYRENLSWRDSAYRKYMSKLLAMNDRYSFDLYLYRASTADDPEIATEPVKEMKYETVYDYWREECGEKMLPTPPEIEVHPNYTHYPDAHYNRGGNRVIGEWLYERLREKKVLP